MVAVAGEDVRRGGARVFEGKIWPVDDHIKAARATLNTMVGLSVRLIAGPEVQR